MNGFDFYIMNAKCNENDYEGLATAKRSKKIYYVSHRNQNNPWLSKLPSFYAMVL